MPLVARLFKAQKWGESLPRGWKDKFLTTGKWEGKHIAVKL